MQKYVSDKLLRLFDILVNFPLATKETVCNHYL